MPEILNSLGLALIIILARIMDVSLGTLRIILISKGLKKFAPVIGFFEVLIWIIIVKQIITDVSHPITYIAYALGYAFGTFIGIYIEGKLSLGKVMIRIICKDNDTELANILRKNKLGVTIVDAQGKDSQVKILFSIVNRKNLNTILTEIRSFDPELFYTIEDVHTVNKGYFSSNRTTEKIYK